MGDNPELVRLEAGEGGVATLVLANPSMRNAITRELSAQMNGVLARVAGDRSIRALIVTGEGDESFCGGMSLKDFLELRPQAWKLYEPGLSMLDWWRKLRELPQPTIAAINGWCVGGGFCVLHACDLALAADHARFSLSEINFGSIPGGGAMRAALELMPQKAAMHLILTGQPIDADEACRQGLVNRVVPRAQLRAEALALAQGLARHSWQILEWCKRTAHGLRGIADRTLAIEYETAMAHFVASARPPVEIDKQLAAFRDKRYKPGVEAFPEDDER
jgi:trans-feruloyl-CoA hydratase/vanillin synthase